MPRNRDRVPPSFLRLVLASGLYSLLLSAAGCGAPPTTEKPDSGTRLPPDAGISNDPGTPSSGQILCKAGFYSGEFTGKYKPGVFGLGVIESPVEFDVQGASSNGYPALSFTLTKYEEGGGVGDEFATYGVHDGCMVGSANVKGTDSPFVGRIDGTLNCQTGAFSGTITGRYDLVGLGLLTYDFTGPTTGQFQLPQAQITGGLWNVKEPDALLGGAAGGGGGEWSAIWKSDAPPAGKDPCSSANLPDAGTNPGTADAGTNPGTADAGTNPGTVDAGTNEGAADAGP